MAGVAGTCSSGLLLRSREPGSLNVQSPLVQYNGLRPLDSVKMAVSLVSANGKIASKSSKNDA